jgi:hypothetical protein
MICAGIRWAVVAPRDCSGLMTAARADALRRVPEWLAR